MIWKERHRKEFLSLLIALTYFALGCLGEETENVAASIPWTWASVVGYVVMVVIFGIFGISVTVCAFVCCWCNEKRKKKRVQIMPEIKPPPMWSTHLVIQPEFVDQGFEKTSDGMTRIDLYRVMRTRSTTICNDGARWDVPMISGKHVFEIIWHWTARGVNYGAIGVGTEEASLRVKSTHSVVGYDAESWGLLIVKRRCQAGGKMLLGACPHDGSYVPDRFFMYVDLDEGKLGYGTDVSYWGDVITDLPTNRKRPLYVLVGMDMYQSEVKVSYKGSADPNAISTYAMAPGPAYTSEAGSSHVIAVKPPDYSETPTAPRQQGLPGPPPNEYLYNESPPPYSNSPQCHGAGQSAQV